MWPILTVSFLLQLTDEEQLFAQCMPPLPMPIIPELRVPAAPDVRSEALDAPWPEGEDRC